LGVNPLIFAIKGQIMKININYTVEVNKAVIKEYMQDLGVTDETLRQFVQSHMIASGIGVLEESLANNGFGHEPIHLLKGSIY
jgi:hypothetical protein